MKKAIRNSKTLTYNFQGRKPEKLEKVKERERIIKNGKQKLIFA